MLTPARPADILQDYRDDVHYAPDGLSKADEANPQAAGVCEFVT